MQAGEEARPPRDLQIREVDRSQLGEIRRLNVTIFGEERVINTFDREDLMLLVAYVGGRPVGFKVGYRESPTVFYSAKGGTLPAYRRRGIARALLQAMIERLQARGYRRLAYDTFPNKHPGMTVMGLAAGFRVVKADFNHTYRDYRLRFEIDLQDARSRS